MAVTRRERAGWGQGICEVLKGLLSQCLLVALEKNSDNSEVLDSSVSRTSKEQWGSYAPGCDSQVLCSRHCNI